jgi:hypothetical protein
VLTAMGEFNNSCDCADCVQTHCGVCGHQKAEVRLNIRL